MGQIRPRVARGEVSAVVRGQQGPRVRGSKAGGTLDLRLLDRLERGGLVEVFDMFLPAGTEYIGKPHGSGVVERVLVQEGTITVGPASDPLPPAQPNSSSPASSVASPGATAVTEHSKTITRRKSPNPLGLSHQTLRRGAAHSQITRLAKVYV